MPPCLVPAVPLPSCHRHRLPGTARRAGDGATRVARLRRGVGAASPAGSPAAPRPPGAAPSLARASRSRTLPAGHSPRGSAPSCPAPRRGSITGTFLRVPLHGSRPPGAGCLLVVAAPGSCFLPPSRSKQARIQLSAPQDGENNPQACGRRQECLQHRWPAGNPSPACSRGALGCGAWPHTAPGPCPVDAASHRPRGAGTLQPHAVPLRSLRSCPAPQHPQGNLAKDVLLAFTNCSCHRGACQAWAGLGAGLVPPVRLQGAFPPGAGPAA